MRSCTYISGPPCVGKSTVARAVSARVESLLMLGGDGFWMAHADLAFDRRLAATNRDLLSALDSADARDVLCEWVPWHREFVQAVHEVCDRRRRRLLHVVLTAPLDTLRRRKLARDGNEDVLVNRAPIATIPAGCTQMVFDCQVEHPGDIATAISAWILSVGEPITKF